MTVVVPGGLKERCSLALVIIIPVRVTQLLSRTLHETATPYVFEACLKTDVAILYYGQLETTFEKMYAAVSPQCLKLGGKFP